MEDLAICAQNIAAHWAAILAFVAMIIAVLVFCFRRTFMSLCYGLCGVGCTYVAAYLIVPNLVWVFVLGTAGVGALACEGYW